MIDVPLSPEWLVSIVAVILALVFDWFPGLSKWFNSLTTFWKQFGMFILLLATSIVVFVLGCFSLLTLPLTCTFAGGLEMLKIFITAITVNQAIHLLLKPTAAMRQRMFK